jgi:hypothetical protein
MRLVTTRHSATLACLAVSFCLVFAVGQNQPRHYRGSKLGVVCDVPKGWNVAESEPILRFWSFDPALRVRALVVPLGGAEISVVGPPPGIGKGIQWQESQWKSSQSYKQIEQSRLSTRGFGLVGANLVRWREETDVAGIDVYLDLEPDKPLKIQLFYRGQSNSARFEKDLRSVIASLRRR